MISSDRPHDAFLRRLVIDHLGAQGDGRAQLEGRWVSVPFTLPGETVEVRGEGDRLTVETLLTSSADRIPLPCRHFGHCGGCSLQHLAAAPYAAFKRDLIFRTLKSRGLEAEIAPAWITPSASRRRATFAARKAGRQILLGFHGRRSHELTSLEECPVLRAPLIAAVPRLREIAGLLLTAKDTLSLLVTETATGLDLHITGLARSVSALARAEAASQALRAGFARVSLEGDDILTDRQPLLPAGHAQMQPPPGGFLQASAEAEAEMARLVLAHLKGTQNGADLFSGCGTFALRMAQYYPVTALESGRAAIAALQAAARAAPGLKPVTAQVRDLFRNPVSTSELAGFDGLVLDPPRAGAAAQSAELAASSIPRIAYVSCDPATLARDLRTLTDGGYRIIRIHPIDQFLWSSHVEAVALMEKA